MSQFVDAPRKVRAGEEPDAERLRAYLQRELAMPGAALEVAQYPSGHSNLTYFVRLGERELVLRRPPIGANVKRGHDMEREHRILGRLSALNDKIPKPVLYCDDDSVIGAHFFLMERVKGVILRKTVGPELKFDARVARGLCESALDALVDLHRIDLDTAGLRDLGNPDGYVERQVVGLAQRYADAKTDDIAEVDTAIGWLGKHIPRSGATAVLHGDYKYDNLVLDPNDLTRVIGILDWEIATVGDPLMDLGVMLAYWVQASDSDLFKLTSLVPTCEPGSYTRAELAERYAHKAGRDLSNVIFYYCYGLMRIAVIAQQIYARYKNGLTKDERFANMLFGVQLLSQQAVEYCGKTSL